MMETTGEEAIPKVLKDTEITTEENGIVNCASGFIQVGEESTTTSIAFNCDDTEQPEWTEGKTTNNNPIHIQLSLSGIFDLETLFEKIYDSDGASLL